ncbi:MAG: nucleoside hydrolase [Alphaproteobacteria bacterium]|nr:nucleoside hydrolase [Alphaproteobacteria bacterium]
MRRKIVIDTDPGVDDALAILLALASPELDVLGIAAVAGNTPLPLTERNARALVELAGRADIPVHAGCARPIGRALVTSEHVHGPSGLGTLKLPAPRIAAAPMHGVDFLIETLRREAPGTVTLCALGPLTNIGLALVKAPDISGRVQELVLMGGASHALGNVTPAAEFNIHVDPLAAELVFASGMPITMIPLDLTHQVPATPARVRSIAALGNRCGSAVAELLAPGDYRGGAFGQAGRPLHDPCVIAWLLASDLFEGDSVNVAIETASPLTLGMTIVDWRGISGRPANARVLHTIDADGFYRLLTEQLGRLP